jgi:hypothetical protein
MTRIQIKSMVQILSISLPSRVITTEIRLDWFCNCISTIWAEKGAKGAGLMGISLFGWEHHFGRGCRCAVSRSKKIKRFKCNLFVRVGAGLPWRTLETPLWIHPSNFECGRQRSLPANIQKTGSVLRTTYLPAHCNSLAVCKGSNRFRI